MMLQGKGNPTGRRGDNRPQSTSTSTSTSTSRIAAPTSVGRRRNAQSSSALCSNIVGILALGLLLLISNNNIVIDHHAASPKSNLIFFGSNANNNNNNSNNNNYEDVDVDALEEEDEERKRFFVDPSVMENRTVAANAAGKRTTTTIFSSFTNPILQTKMEQAGSALQLSRRQQAKFDSLKGRLMDVFPNKNERRFQTRLDLWGANIINDEYAYIHIFKNGGTTIASQTGRDHTPIQNRQVLSRKWFTFVRDPIEHFLSGWSECGNRYREGRLKKLRDEQEQQQSNNITTTTTTSTTNHNKDDEPIPQELLEDYDTRIRKWLEKVRKMARPGHKFWCQTHSFPQVNSLLGVLGTIPNRLEIVGDLQELPAVLKLLIGFEYNAAIETGRNATADPFLQKYYPKRVDLLSDDTLRSLCDFLAIDYFLLDYDLPTACDDMEPGGYTTSTSTSTSSTIVRTPKSNALASIIEKQNSQKQIKGKDAHSDDDSSVAADTADDSSDTIRVEKSQILERMEEKGSSLELSRRQQASFDVQRLRVHRVFPKERRFQARLMNWGANIVTDRYAYIHIFKNGGTTIALQTRRNHTAVHDPEIVKRRWFTLVRDPIEHFLSGWAHCGGEARRFRLKQKGKDPNQPFDTNNPSEPIPPRLGNLDYYDMRIRMWLKRTRTYAQETSGWRCEVHSLPQVNSILNGNGMMPSNLEIVGDLKELPAVLEDLIGFEKYNATIETGRNATGDLFLQTYYPRRLDLLSNTTIRDLCDFLAIDYFLLNYSMPTYCHDMGSTGYTNWTRTTTPLSRHKQQQEQQQQQQRPRPRPKHWPAGPRPPPPRPPAMGQDKPWWSFQIH